MFDIVGVDVILFRFVFEFFPVFECDAICLLVVVPWMCEVEGAYDSVLEEVKFDFVGHVVVWACC